MHTRIIASALLLTLGMTAFAQAQAQAQAQDLFQPAAILQRFADFRSRVRDVTGDGRPDVVGSGFNGIEVIPKNAPGGLDPSRFYPSNYFDEARVGDLNGDRHLDVIGLQDRIDGHINTDGSAPLICRAAGQRRRGDY